MKKILLFICLTGTGFLHAAADAAEDSPVCLDIERKINAKINAQTFGLIDLLRTVRAEPTVQNPHLCFAIAQRYDVLNDTEHATEWYTKSRDILLGLPNIDFNVCNLLTEVYQALGDHDCVGVFAHRARDYAVTDRTAKAVIRDLRYPTTDPTKYDASCLGNELSSHCTLTEYYVDRGCQELVLHEVQKINELLRYSQKKRALFDDPTVRDIMCRIYCIRGLHAELQKKYPVGEYHKPLEKLCFEKDNCGQLVPDADSKMASAKHALFASSGHLLYFYSTRFPESVPDFVTSAPSVLEIYATLFTSALSNDTRSFQVAFAVHAFKKKWPERFEGARAMARRILDRATPHANIFAAVSDQSSSPAEKYSIGGGIISDDSMHLGVYDSPPVTTRDAAAAYDNINRLKKAVEILQKQESEEETGFYFYDVSGHASRRPFYYGNLLKEIGIAYKNNKDWNNAIEYLTRAVARLKHENKFYCNVLVELADVYIEKDIPDPDKAIELFKQAVQELQPEDPLYFNVLTRIGLCCSHKKEWGRAEAFLVAAIGSMDRARIGHIDHAYALNALGFVYENKNSIYLAYHNYRHALTSQENFVFSLINLLYIYATRQDECFLFCTEDQGQIIKVPDSKVQEFAQRLLQIPADDEQLTLYRAKHPDRYARALQEAGRLVNGSGGPVGSAPATSSSYDS